MFTFPKSEKLCSKKIIKALFENGNSLNIYPFKVFWLSEKLNIQDSVQLAISVPKRNFKKAVDRNLLKRRIRESYRHKKQILFNHSLNNNLKISLILIYISKEILDYKFIDLKIEKVLNKIVLTNEKNCN